MDDNTIKVINETMIVWDGKSLPFTVKASINKDILNFTIPEEKKCKNKAKNVTPDKRREVLVKCMRKTYSKTATFIKTRISKCNKANNPGKCKKHFLDQIHQFKALSKGRNP